MTFDLDAVRPVMPLFGIPSEMAISAKQLQIERIDVETAVDANYQWHSVLPEVFTAGQGNLLLTFGAVVANGLYGVAIWMRPIAANRMKKESSHLLELRRLAIPPYSPKYTATRMLGQMSRWIKREHPDICTILSYQATDVHSGTIYKAANWSVAATMGSYTPWAGGRGRSHRGVQQNQSPKVRWEYALRKCECGGLEETNR